MSPRWRGKVTVVLRFTTEVVEAVAAAIGANRTALRISPANPFNDIVEDEHTAIYPLLLEAINPLGLAYLHVMETMAPDLTPALREQWNGVFMLNPVTPGSRTGVEQLPLVQDGAADILSFGQLFMANPDLPHRLAAGAPLNEADMSKAYGGDATGYTDYPTLENS
ncbi:hypothetical protein [Streptomyces sp. NPDC048643]|uniref:oxidoreductase n=1 Tax=Streptomyces sp. NPDC048643 TaxID=3155637 RepID=UPI0034406E19